MIPWYFQVESEGVIINAVPGTVTEVDLLSYGDVCNVCDDVRRSCVGTIRRIIDTMITAIAE